MDKLNQAEQDEIVRSYSERAKAIVGDMDDLRGVIRERLKSDTRAGRDEIAGMIEAGNARAPIRAGVEEILQHFERQISEQRKLIDLIRHAMTEEA